MLETSQEADLANGSERKAFVSLEFDLFQSEEEPVYPEKSSCLIEGKLTGFESNTP